MSAPPVTVQAHLLGDAEYELIATMCAAAYPLVTPAAWKLLAAKTAEVMQALTPLIVSMHSPDADPRETSVTFMAWSAALSLCLKANQGHAHGEGCGCMVAAKAVADAMYVVCRSSKARVEA